MQIKIRKSESIGACEVYKRGILSRLFSRRIKVLTPKGERGFLPFSSFSSRVRFLEQLDFQQRVREESIANIAGPGRC